MTKTVTESIYNGVGVVVPLADVQHIEKHNPLGLIVVTKHTRWDADRDMWANNIWIDKGEADAFVRAWCRYRSELEADTLADLSPAVHSIIADTVERCARAVERHPWPTKCAESMWGLERQMVAQTIRETCLPTTE